MNIGKREWARDAFPRIGWDSWDTGTVARQPSIYAGSSCPTPPGTVLGHFGQANRLGNCPSTVPMGVGQSILLVIKGFSISVPVSLLSWYSPGEKVRAHIRANRNTQASIGRLI